MFRLFGTLILRPMAVACAVFCLPGGLRCEESLNREIAILKDAGIERTAKSLLAAMKLRTPSKHDLEELSAAISQLKDPSFVIRERASGQLAKKGPPAVPLLRKLLLDRDPDVARRAEICLTTIAQESRPNVTEAIVRVLCRGESPEIVGSLVEFIPFAEDEGVQEEVLIALAHTGIRCEADRLTAQVATADSQPSRRAASAVLLSGKGANRNDVDRALLLLKDRDPTVRLYTALALTLAGREEGIPVLIDLLGEGPARAAIHAEAVLCQAAGKEAPSVTLGNDRAKCFAAWTEWARVRAKAKAIGPADIGRQAQQLILVANLDGGCVLAIDENHRERWRCEDLDGPVDVQMLASGRLLIAENHGKRITERTVEGKILWERRTDGLPGSCQRLSSGNTLICTKSSLFELDSTGATLWSNNRLGGLYSARKLRNGQVMALSSEHAIIRCDSSGRQLAQYSLRAAIQPWSSFSLREDGHFLVASRSVVNKLDHEGKQIWAHYVANCVGATEKTNGNILICDPVDQRIVELDPAGKTLRAYGTKGRPWRIEAVSDKGLSIELFRPFR